MPKHIFRPLYFHVFLVLTALLFGSSCISPKKFSYFNDLPKDSAHISLPPVDWPQSVIQRDDILEIKISGKNDISAMDFNNKSGGFGNGQAVIPQYLVNKEGEIDLYLAGKLKVEGLTTDQAKEKITKAVGAYLMEPVVNVRITNFRFTVLGEVRSPGSYNIPHEKISILEALGMAGDITYFGMRNRIRVYRDSSGTREMGTVNLQNKNIFTSPYFYLKRNDVIYVETNTRYRQTNDAYTRVALIVGILSSVLASIVIFKK